MKRDRTDAVVGEDPTGEVRRRAPRGDDHVLEGEPSLEGSERRAPSRLERDLPNRRRGQPGMVEGEPRDGQCPLHVDLLR